MNKQTRVVLEALSDIIIAMIYRKYKIKTEMINWDEEIMFICDVPPHTFPLITINAESNTIGMSHSSNPNTYRISLADPNLMILIDECMSTYIN